jgi:hypothetical protein
MAGARVHLPSDLAARWLLGELRVRCALHRQLRQLAKDPRLVLGAVLAG